MPACCDCCRSRSTFEIHNETVCQKLKIGDLVEFRRGMYSHWAVFIGNDLIVHIVGEGFNGTTNRSIRVRPSHVFTVSGKTFNKAKICVENLSKVVFDCKLYINNSRDKKRTPLRPEEIVQKALSMLGPVSYSIFTRNCEHFAMWCRYGIPQSYQVNAIVTRVVICIIGIAVLGLIFVLIALL